MSVDPTWRMSIVGITSVMNIELASEMPNILAPILYSRNAILNPLSFQ